MLTFSLVGNNNVHSFSFESLSNLTCELKYGEQAGSLFEEINASKSSPTFDRCLSSWVRRKICARRTNSVVQTFFVLILEQCSWVGQVLLCTRERENLAAFQGFGSRGTVCFQSNSDLNLHFALPKMFDDVHSHENH